MKQPLPIDTYSLTISELLHEVCVELLDGQDMLDDLRAEKETVTDGQEETVRAYSFAEEQIRMRMERYRELGDRVDEIIQLYDELQDELYGDTEDADDEIEELPYDTFLHEYGTDEGCEEDCDCDCDCCDDHHGEREEDCDCDCDCCIDHHDMVNAKKKDKKKEKKKAKKTKKDKKKKKK